MPRPSTRSYAAALGLVEVRGFANAVLTADAMVKSANVRLQGQHELNPGQLTIVVEGDLGACQAAVERGAGVARACGALLAMLVKGRPDDGLHQLLPDTAHKPVPSTSGAPAGPAASAQAGRGPASKRRAGGAR